MADAGNKSRNGPEFTESSRQKEGESSGKISKKVLLVAMGMTAVLVAGVFFAFQFVEDERKRELNQWQIRLGIVADTRVAAINEWSERQFDAIRALTENASLQLYMTELAFAEASGPGKDPGLSEDAAAQEQYLRNLLVATAERSGFAAPSPPAGEVAANVERVGVAGLGLIDAGGVPLVNTPGMPPMNATIAAAVEKALEGKPALIDVFQGASGEPTIGFALPVFSLQGDETAGIGAVVGLKLLGDDLWKRLAQPGDIEKTAETYLVRKKEGTIEYISALADGTPPLNRSMAVDTPELAASFAVASPGGFGLKRDYAGYEVLTTSRNLARLPWTLVRKITRREALSTSETRLRTILVVLILVIVGVAVAIVAVWRHGSGLRAAEAAQKFKIAAERFENLSRFMKLVTNSQPHGIVAVDGDTHYTFANEPAAREGGIEPEDMIGKTMASVIGPVKATAYAGINKEVLDTGERRSKVHAFEKGESLAVVRSDHIPLSADGDRPPGVLMILDDITELTNERKRSERMLRELIDTLVGVVDRRDPWSANHSNRVANVATSIAGEMGLEEPERKTVDIAGSLMNLGKIFIPHELLVKVGNLTSEERHLISNAYLVSVDLLEGVTFDGPVVETIRQMGETWDGNGPLGLEGEGILRSSRILNVANAFVGMVSARAYRGALTFEKATDILLGDSGSRFDRKPVSALINYLENRGGAEKWACFREKPEFDDESKPT